MLYFEGMSKWLLISIWLMPGLSCWTIWQKSTLGCFITGVTMGEINVDITENNQAKLADFKIQLSKCAYEIELLTLMMVSTGHDASNPELSEHGLEDNLPQLMENGVPGLNIFKESQGSAENDVPRYVETNRCSEFMILKP